MKEQAQFAFLVVGVFARNIGLQVKLPLGRCRGGIVSSIPIFFKLIGVDSLINNTDPLNNASLS